jgi:hypothetical protein
MAQKKKWRSPSIRGSEAFHLHRAGTEKKILMSSLGRIRKFFLRNT